MGNSFIEMTSEEFQKLKNDLLGTFFMARNDEIDGFYFSDNTELLFATDYVTYKFVTCAGVRNKLNFELYLSPYDKYAWICILTTFTFLIPILLVLLLVFGKSASLSRIYNSFGTMFVLIEIGVEDSATQTGKQRIVLGSALLLGLVLTNAYKGIFVSDLIAPAQPG